MRSETTATLKRLVDSLNAAHGYRDRYRLVVSAYRTSHKPRRCAVVCSVGPLDRNDSGWRDPVALIAWLDGALEGTSATLRRRCRI